MRSVAVAILFACPLTAQLATAPERGDRDRGPLDPAPANFLLGTPAFPGQSLVGVAYDPQRDRYLAVWPGGNLGALGGQLVTGAGDLVGDEIGFGGGSRAPEVAVVGSGQATQFVVVTSGQGPVGVSTWPGGGTLLLGSLSATQTWPDVGGGIGRDDAVIVYYDFDNGGTARAVQFDALTMTAGSTFVDVSGRFGHFPRISPNAGPGGEYLVTWTTENTINGDIMGRIIDRDLNLLTPRFVVSAGPTRELTDGIDGDGTEWLVAYSASEDAFAAIHDAFARKVSYDAATGQVTVSTAIPIATTPTLRENCAGVAWTGESYLVTYEREFQPFSQPMDIDVWVVSLDEHGCQPCGGAFQISTSTGQEHGAIASARSAGAAGQDALVVFIANSSAVRGRMFLGEDGRVTDLGGGCAGGGIADATCAAVGGTFGLRTKFAAPSAPGALLLGASPDSLPCGPCTLTTSPILSVPAVTDEGGAAAVAIPLTDPALVGAQLVAQWLVAGNGGCVAIASLSNGLLVTVE